MVIVTHTRNTATMEIVDRAGRFLDHDFIEERGRKQHGIIRLTGARNRVWQ